MYEIEQERIVKEQAFVMDYFRQSMELLEKNGNEDLNLTRFEELLRLDLEVDGVENLTEEEEADFFALLQSENVGKCVTNMAEYLLMTQAMKGAIKVSSQVDRD